jgi:Dolichyl-phosphate-mannose-protein mannosyltransferase
VWCSRALLVLAVVIAVAVSTRGITSEGTGSLQGDMPRYLMNGALAHDFIADGGAFSVQGVLDYAYRYYARYPALSLGHHPPLLSMLLVPAYAVMGTSVAAGRVVILLCFLVALWLLWLVARHFYDEVASSVAVLVFVTVPYLAEFSQSVMSEMPTLMCVLLAVHRLLCFRETGRERDYALFALAALVSLLAKQTAALALPLYLVLLLDRRGRTVLARPRIFAATVSAGIVTVVVGVATVAMSPFNVQVVADALRGQHVAALEKATLSIVRWQMGYVLAAVTVVALLLGLRRRVSGSALWLTWIGSVLGGVVFLIGPWDTERYAVLAVPAYCLAVASLLSAARSRVQYLAATATVAAVIGWQGVGLLAKQPAGADGYERVARYVLSSTPAPTVLFSGSVDTGYFVFFVRKHDAERRMAVLRADKLLTTSRMGTLSVEDRIGSAAEIYTRLKRFGTRYVVIEDKPSGSIVLDMLRSELQTHHFVERLRVPVGTTDRRLRGVSLVVYEYLDATAADPGATIDIDVPLVGRHVAVPLSEVARPLGVDGPVVRADPGHGVH